MNGGAPPDGLYIKGQTWGFPPLQPEAIRRQGYRYYIECLRHHMGPADMLRIDHVMGLHRAFWVPDGFSATDGVYVHDRAPEFYAILNLESHRHRVQIVGENLGTVPESVNAAMARRKIYGMHVGQFGVSGDPTARWTRLPPLSSRASTPTTPRRLWVSGRRKTSTTVSLWGFSIMRQTDQERRYRAAQRDALIAYLRAKGYIGEDASEAAVLRGWLSLSRRTAGRVLVDQLGRPLASSPHHKTSLAPGGSGPTGSAKLVFPSRICAAKQPSMTF